MLNQHHGAAIYLAAADQVVNNGEEDNAAVDKHVPIHVAERRRRGLREEQEDPDPGEEAEGDAVDDAAEAAHAPSSLWQRLTPNTSEEYAADRDDVGR